MLPKNEIFIDPGRVTGWVYFTASSFSFTYLYGSFTKSNMEYLTNGLYYMRVKFIDTLNEYKPKRVTIESVDYRTGLKGQTAAKRGDLVKLSILIGVYVGCCLQMNIPYTLILAKEWKGQLTKEATKARVKRITGIDLTNEHIIDALGMGLSRDRNLWNLKK